MHVPTHTSMCKNCMAGCAISCWESAAVDNTLTAAWARNSVRLGPPTRLQVHVRRSWTRGSLVTCTLLDSCRFQIPRINSTSPTRSTRAESTVARGNKVCSIFPIRRCPLTAAPSPSALSRHRSARLTVLFSSSSTLWNFLQDCVKLEITCQRRSR